MNEIKIWYFFFLVGKYSAAFNWPYLLLKLQLENIGHWLILKYIFVGNMELNQSDFYKINLL